MQNLKTITETTTHYLSKEALKKLLLSKKDKIKNLISEGKNSRSITLSATLTGEYMISTAKKRLTSSRQGNAEHWHYSYSVKVDKDKSKKKTFLNLITKQLLDGICEVIDLITWYVGLRALSV